MLTRKVQAHDWLVKTPIDQLEVIGKYQAVYFSGCNFFK